MTLSGSIHVAGHGIISFFLVARYYSTVCTYHIFLIYSSVDGHLGCLRVLAVGSSATRTIEVHIFFQIMFFSEYMPEWKLSHVEALFSGF